MSKQVAYEVNYISLPAVLAVLTPTSTPTVQPPTGKYIHFTGTASLLDHITIDWHHDLISTVQLLIDKCIQFTVSIALNCLSTHITIDWRHYFY